MKTIIAGGRRYEFTDSDFDFLENLDPPISEVVSGCCKTWHPEKRKFVGADWGGEMFAQNKRIPTKLFPADWNKHGRAAGPIRNREMAQYADRLILLPGGKGSASMKREAKKAGIWIIDLTTGKPLSLEPSPTTPGLPISPPPDAPGSKTCSRNHGPSPELKEGNYAPSTTL